MSNLNNTSTHPIRRATYSTLLFAALLVTSISCLADTTSPFPMLADPSGCVIEQITTADHDEYHVHGPSPDGRFLAMAARREGETENNPVEQAYEMDLATGSRTDLSHALTNSGHYSPDGKFIVVAQTTDNGKTDIFEYERATGERRAVASHEAWDWLPSYSPDGRFIVFNSYRVEGQSDIHLFERSTGTLTRLTEDPRYDAHALFSPDGKRILYHRQQGTREEGGYIFDLFVYDMETGQKTQLTEGDYEDSYGAWAPDGRHIVYSSDVGGKHGKHDLYILAPDGKTTTRLTEGDWSDSYSYWSRDGQFIYFNSNRAGAGNVYRMPMDGVECVRAAADTTEFCLDGEFNLGARYQGTEPGVDEFVPTRWCVVTEDDRQRAVFSGSGKSNPDMEGGWTVALLPPDLVRIVNADDPPDIEFHGADSRAEALSVRRMDPRRLVEEHQTTPLEDISVTISEGQLQTLQTSADLPLRGRVPVVWDWNWQDTEHPELDLQVDGEVFFRARGSWRNLSDDEAQRRWRVTPGADPVQVPGEHWPARVNMQRTDLADGVYLISGVRTGFQHLVVDTAEGLVVADAPAGWVELHQIPPADLVPGLGISGLSERFIDYLAEEFPGRPIRAVALTHAHDDHAGGARAFAAAGAAVYAPAEHALFLKTAFSSDNMPDDRFSDVDDDVDVIPVSTVVTLDDAKNPVSLLSIGAGPHGSAALGVHAAAAGYFFVSDLHVPNSEDDTPRAERAATECWFARWAVLNLPPATVVLNSHSAVQTPVSRLESYLQSSLCLVRVDTLFSP